jgi:hypothetical protein
MSEKVLGFREKDADVKSFHNNDPAFWAEQKDVIVEGDEVITDFIISVKKLVPVVSKRKFDREMERKNKRIAAIRKQKGVSLEWLKKYIVTERKRIDNKVEYHNYTTKKMVLRDLLLAAEKEAKRK